MFFVDVTFNILGSESYVRIQKQLISDLMRKIEEIRGKRLGSCRDQREMQYQNKVWMELFQMAEITAEYRQMG
jgi:hypothetical protein